MSLAYREHYQLLYSLLHPATELCFFEEICRLLPIMEDDQSIWHWSLVLIHTGNLFINNDKEYCSGYKHSTLIDEKTSLPLSVRGAYTATTAPYLNIWYLQYFLLIQRRQRNRHNICLFLSNYHIRRHMCLVLSPIDLNLAGHQKHIHKYVSARLFTLSFIGVSYCLPYLLGGDNTNHQFATFKCYAAVWWKFIHWPVEVDITMISYVYTRKCCCHCIQNI